MTSIQSGDESLRAIGIDHSVLIETLESIDSVDHEHTALTQETRFRPQTSTLTAIIEHPGGSKVSTQTIVYNLSSNGAGIATRFYLHRDTPISLKLITNDDKEKLIRGRVMWCEYHENGIHRTGVLFSEPIEPRPFVDPEIWQKFAPEEADTIWDCVRTALYIEKDELETSTISMLLKNANFECTNGDIGEALDLVQTNSYDLILVPDMLDSTKADDMITQLKSNGYKGPIIVLASPKLSRIDHYSKLGVNAVLHKPIQLALLISALRDLFENPDTAAGSESIYTALHEDQCPTEMILMYIDKVKQSSIRLDSDLKTDNIESAIKVCTSLHSSGAGFGYPSLSQHAADVIQAINASASVHEAAIEIRSLLRLINRLEPRK